MGIVIERKECKHPTCGETCRREKKVPTFRKPIARTSKKRAKENRQYLAIRKQFLKVYPKCQAKLDGCKVEAIEIHHMSGRIADNLVDASNFLAVCHNCHKWIETHPREAKAIGLSISRLQVTAMDKRIYAPEEHIC